MFRHSVQIHTIKKGCHRSSLAGFRPLITKGIYFGFIFDQSCVYQTIKPENQHDINKFWGLSESVHHHCNSTRLGWNWLDGALHLWAYTYYKGQRTYKQIGKAHLHAPGFYSIEAKSGAYLHTLYDAQGVAVSAVMAPRAETYPTMWGYQLYPYFGGDEVAPHDITLRIKLFPNARAFALEGFSI